MGALLSRLVAAQQTEPTPARGIPLEYLGRLVRALEHDGPRARTSTAVVPGLVQGLTARELEVRVLAAGKENQAIAKQLVVAVSTVKSTSPTSSRSSAPPTAPRRPLVPASSACSPVPPSSPPPGRHAHHLPVAPGTTKDQVTGHSGTVAAWRFPSSAERPRGRGCGWRQP
jgi:hypothetical protein